mgnify:CR=1 FL=1
MKARASTRDIPVLFMTALNETADKVKAFAAGGVDYITKPIEHEEALAEPFVDVLSVPVMLMATLGLRYALGMTAEAGRELDAALAPYKVTP